MSADRPARKIIRRSAALSCALVAGLAIPCMAVPLPSSQAQRPRPAPLPQSTSPDGSCSEYSRIMRVEVDGNSSVRNSITCRVLTTAGLDIAKRRIFDATNFDVLAARSIDSTGKPHDAVILHHKRSDGSAVVGVEFPALTLGDEYVLETENTGRRQDLDRGMVLSYESVYPLEHFSIRLDAPKGVARVDSADFGTPEYSQSSGRESWSWHASALQPLSLTSAIEPIDVRPRIAIAFFDTFDATMQSLAKRYEEAESRTDRLPAVAREIAAANGSPRDRARAALAWLQQKVAYTDDPALVDKTLLPGSVDETIDRGKGMCRDLVPAYGALLRLLGVRADPVFVSTRMYWQPKVPITQKWNHIITYLPDFDLFVDPSDKNAEFGTWGFDLGHRRGYDLAGARWLDIPFESEWMAERDEAEIFISASGRARASTRLRFTGALADSERGAMAKLAAADTVNQRAAQLLTWVGIQGQGVVRQLDTEQRGVFEYAVDYGFDSAPFLAADGRAPVPVAPSFSNFRLEFLVDGKKTHALCAPRKLEQHLTIHWPAGSGIVRRPEDRRFHDDALGYESTYRVKGADLVVTRTFDTHWPRPICTAEDAGKLASLKEFIAADRAQTVSLARGGAGVGQ